jgi:aspartate kinase
MYIVYKLGGTSQCKIGYDRLINQIKENIINKKQNIVVLSAVSGVTNNLIKFTETKDLKYIDIVLELNYKLITELKLNEKVFDSVKNNLLNLCEKYIKSFDISDIYEKSEIIGYGEVFSSNIFYKYIITTTSEFIIPDIKLFDSYDYIKSKKEIYQCNSTTEFYFDKTKFYIITIQNEVNIFQGFIGSTPSRKKVILGRGGSDTTGSLIASAINAEFYEVWTDVDGIYTADPRIFPATLIDKIDYELVQEIASMGAKVMHPLSIKPCFDKNIPIYVKNTFNESAKGTIITILNECEHIDNKFYAIQKNETIFKIKSLDMWNSIGFLNDIFRKFSENKIDINIVTTSQFSISATTSEQNKYKLMEIKEILADRYEIEMINNCTILSIVKRNIKNTLKDINFININPEIIHISDNNMTLNLVLRDFNTNIINYLF